MRYLARTATGDALLGDDEGFVPLSSADPSMESIGDALRAAPDGLPDPDEATASRVPRDHLALDAPLTRPGKLFGIGLNYADHAEDLDEVRPDEPASFFKPATALTGPGGPIRLPPTDVSERVTAEGELAVVIGRRCKDVAPEDVDDVVAGYVPVIDMTAEDVLQRNPRFLTRAKSFDSFLVVGPHVAVPEEPMDLTALTVRTVVNGEVRSENTVERMLFKPRELVSFHSSVMTLEPGDVISTGTPGAFPISPGDRARAVVEDVGSVAADVVR
ncbi:MAG: fumarylacetoacetate hydrolase family protein [Halobacteriaceae archaeon]